MGSTYLGVWRAVLSQEVAGTALWDRVGIPNQARRKFEGELFGASACFHDPALDAVSYGKTG